MALDSELLALLVCPKTRGPLQKIRLPEQVARRLEDKYRERMAGEPTVVEEGLYSRDARLVYPIVSDIPVMLIDEAFPSSEIGKE